MNQSSIFAPMFVMFLLTIIVWTHMYVKRILFFRKSRFDPQETSAEAFARAAPPDVSNPSDNLKNLFEIPVLFYALVLYLYLTGSVDSVFLACAWIFAVFRVAHSLVHCTINKVLLRFYLYQIATLTLWFMIIRASVQLFAYWF